MHLLRHISPASLPLFFSPFTRRVLSAGIPALAWRFSPSFPSQPLPIAASAGEPAQPPAFHRIAEPFRLENLL